MTVVLAIDCLLQDRQREEERDGVRRNAVGMYIPHPDYDYRL